MSGHESVSFAGLGESRRAGGMLNPTRDKNEGTRRGGEKGRHLWPPLIQKLESKSDNQAYIAKTTLWYSCSITGNHIE